MTRGRRRVLPLVALALVATGCGGDGPAGGSGSPAGDEPAVRLLQAGNQPRRELRLALVEGATARSSLTVKLAVQLEALGQPLPSAAVPPIRVDLGTTVNRVEPNGNARLSIAYGRVEVVDDGSATPAVIDQLRSSGIDKLAALRSETTLTPRGVAVDSSTEIPEDLPDSLGQVVDQLAQQTGSLTVPFPDEPVGVGASWRATTSVKVGGATSKLEITYLLKQLDADGYVLGVSYLQTAGRQKADFPGVPAGTEVEIRDLRITGQGETAGTLGSPLPTRSSLAAEGTINMDVEANGERGTLLQRLSLEQTVSALPPG